MLEAFETAINKITRKTFYITYKAVGRINLLVSVKKKINISKTPTIIVGLKVLPHDEH